MIGSGALDIDGVHRDGTVEPLMRQGEWMSGVMSWLIGWWRCAMRTRQAGPVACGLAIGAVLVMAALPAHGQTPATGRVMREKLVHAQGLLEAIVTSNFQLLERETAALADAPKMKGWMILQLPEYRKHSEAFLRAIADMSAAAKARDLDQAAAHYQALTASCYQCHKYIKAQRLAK